MKPTMQDNFNLLEERVLDSLDKTDLGRIKYELEKIKDPTITTGVGGSSVVSTYAAKVLETKNNIITTHQEPRDLPYKNLKGFTNVLACSYSGNNFGVETAFNNDLKKYLLSVNTSPDEAVTTLKYDTSLPKEDSFVSLAATLIPMSILLAYYNDLDISVIKDILKTAQDYSISPNQVFEILSGEDTSTAATYLESTLTEASLAIPLVHDKYSYCHGRSTTTYHHNNSLIHLSPTTELDQVIAVSSYPYYQEVIELPPKYSDPVINDFYLTYQAMLLTKALAEQEGKDLSRVEYSPAVKQLYKFSGKL